MLSCGLDSDQAKCPFYHWYDEERKQMNPMQVEHFDLNDIQNEPTDEQLQSLMEAVADDVRRKHEEVRK